MKGSFGTVGLLILGILTGFLARPASAQPSNLASTVHLFSSNQVNTVYWSDSSYYGIVLLQTSSSLSPTATWTNLATDDQFASLNSFPATGGYAAFATNRYGSRPAWNCSSANQQQFFRTSTRKPIPACCFTIFYNGQLEFSGASTLVINGRVHANGAIYVGTVSNNSLVFNGPVTTTTNLAAPIMDGENAPWPFQWAPTNSSQWYTTFNGSPAYITNTPVLYNPLLSGLVNPTNYHFMIDVPLASEDSMSVTGQVRLFNQAQMLLLVTNSPSGTNPAVWLTLQTSVNGAVPGHDLAKLVYVFTNQSPASLATNLTFLSLTNLFYDQREYKTNLVTQLDVGRFSVWISTNSVVQSKLPAAANIYPTILYVADRRNVNAKQLAVVRLVNGAQLSANNGLGFSLATPNPLYVQGNYNIQIAGNTNQSVSTTDTTYTVPAALFSDALTVLSSNWLDSESYTAYTNGSSIFTAADTTINAAIITGTVASTGNGAINFSGGVHNLPRLLENWSSVGSGGTQKNLWLNTSLIRFWDSAMATNQFRNPTGYSPAPVNPYYNPPARHFNLDQNFLDPAKIPPGIPLLSY